MSATKPARTNTARLRCANASALHLYARRALKIALRKNNKNGSIPAIPLFSIPCRSQLYERAVNGRSTSELGYANRLTPALYPPTPVQKWCRIS
jgi:hypothetical protein